MKQEIYSHPNGNYNDIWLKGELVKKGNISRTKEYEQISDFCRNYKRPFSTLDLGAAEGYFTFRLADDFDGVFTAVEGDVLRNLPYLCQQNDNEKVLLMMKQLNLENLMEIASVHYFDVILGLNIIHHFDEDFRKVLGVIMGMCSYCFLQHPSEEDDNDSYYGGVGIKNFHRIGAEKLDLDRYNAKLLESKGEGRKMYLLENTNPYKGIVRRHTQGNFYEEGEGIILYSNFENISVNYLHREENRPWFPGMNLRTFFENGGVYPTPKRIFQMIDEIDTDKPTPDLGPGNVLLDGRKLDLIDQGTGPDDFFDPICHTKEGLKKVLATEFGPFK